MKYSLEIEINQPIDKVIELFDNADYLEHWQPGLQSVEHISGELGKPGAKTKLRYLMGKREVEMIETITARDLPKEFSATFEANGVLNIQKNLFRAMGTDRTKWISDNEFQFSNLPMKLMGWLMPGAFKKQSKIYLDAFKKFAEDYERVLSTSKTL